ncbi:hypothetical protein OIU78_029063, partial [Salix suchowensis]
MRSNIDPTFYSLVGPGRSGGGGSTMASLLKNPYIPHQCMENYHLSTSLGSTSM